MRKPALGFVRLDKIKLACPAIEMCFMQIESVLQTKNRSELAKNRFSVALM